MRSIFGKGTKMSFNFKPFDINKNETDFKINDMAFIKTFAK